MQASTEPASLIERLRSAGAAFLTTLRRGRDPRARSADEFRVASLLHQMRAPMQSSSAWSWSLEQIMSARDQQMAGQFSAPVKLAAAMRTDDACAFAFRNRTAPARALSVQLKPAQGARGGRVAADAEPLFGNDGSAITRETEADLTGDLANHGIAVGYNTWTARADGSRVDVQHQCWPLEFVAWDPLSRMLYTQVDTSTGAPALPRSARGSCFVDIVHGDGLWTVYQAIGSTGGGGQPWTKDAAILSGCLVWARHAFGTRDGSKGSASHGNAKVLGTLPQDVDLQIKDDDDNVVINPVAAEYLALLADLSSQDAPYGIQPFGCKTDYIVNGSRAWEVWQWICLDALKAACRIYLGSDAVLGSAGGAPGVDIATLFQIASTIFQADLGALERGEREGVLEPWGAINYGDSLLVPRRLHIVPDPDTQRVREEQAKNEAAFTAAIVARRGASLEVTQEVVDELAERYGVAAGTLAALRSTGFQLAPTDLARVVTANEARGSVGLAPRDDGDVPVSLFGLPPEAPPTSGVRTVPSQAPTGTGGAP